MPERDHTRVHADPDPRHDGPQELSCSPAAAVLLPSASASSSSASSGAIGGRRLGPESLQEFEQHLLRDLAASSLQVGQRRQAEGLVQLVVLGVERAVEGGRRHLHFAAAASGRAASLLSALAPPSTARTRAHGSRHFVQVFDILITAESSNASYRPEILFLNASGFVLVRLGEPATLYCRILLVDDQPETRYRVSWETGRLGEVAVVAHIDQSKDRAPTIDPRYRDRVTLLSRGAENHLHFAAVQDLDFGEYFCKGQIAGQEGESFSSLSVLAEDTRMDPELLGPEGGNESLVPRVVSMNSSGRVWARLGAPAQLDCRFEASTGGPGTRYSLQWEAVRRDNVTLARVDLGPGGTRFLDPRYRDRLAVSAQDTGTQLSFRHVKRQDYGQYLCKAWVTGRPQDMVIASVTLEEDVVAETRPSTPTPAWTQPQPRPEILALNTSGTVRARLGEGAALSCRIVALHAGPETRYRLRWESRRTPNLTVAQVDQADGRAPRVGPAFRDRVTMTSRGPDSELRFRIVKEQDPGEYRCRAGISGRRGEAVSSPVFLLKAKQKVLPTSSETAILWLILHFFVVLFAMAIGIGSCFLTGTKTRILPEHV